MAKLESGTRIYGNVTIDTFVTATGNVTGGNLLTGGLISATANVTANNGMFTNIVNVASHTGAVVSVTANVTGGNLLTGGLISATANVTANNGMFTNIVNVASHTGAVVSVTGNVTANNGMFTNIVNVASHTGAVVSVTGNVTGGNILTAGLVSAAGNSVFANVVLKKFNETVLASANTGASISPDVSTGTIFNYLANANFTFSTLTNAVAGTSATIIITQDSVGSKTLTSTMKFANASKTLSTAASSIDVISVFYDGTTYYASLTKGYA